ncbi:uncharacterized protein MICPUCDRAFT_38739 [Micromonas pusilla CCMP1545]|jgi:hypothetical protein|uniref:Predicted protein n=1 Tax=Micromonas pusilla (strain CCMP1545) TaxID=564608 RepID=C1MLU4_MICPC|nr:uncharacterized protein MICPUCDRAFT_38739 [Micromonas pusilla CCMP1545]EEH58469.1 predicted protein [Micromonas pusilla CCMP1545]|eukprot:XP_003056824.1 predicted protein [Micromonas pusilla CCMP1545]
MPPCFNADADRAMMTQDARAEPEVAPEIVPAPPPRESDAREDVVAALAEALECEDKRLVRRFAATRAWDYDATMKLLREYVTWRKRVGLDDGSLCRAPGVRRELRKRHTMRLLNPKDARRRDRDADAAAAAAAANDEQRLTFLELHTPAMWPTACDVDGSPVIYTNMRQYQRGVGKAVENTFVWILETVCGEMDDAASAAAAAVPATLEGERADARDREMHGGKFTIFLDLSSCDHVPLHAFFSIGRVLQNAVKKGFRGRLRNVYVFPTGRGSRALLKILKPFLGKYTPPKVKLVPKEDKERLCEIFTRETLPPHLGGTSKLMAVDLEAEAAEEDVAAAAAAAAAVAPGAAASDADGDEHHHEDLKWFLKVPAFNFVVLVAMTAHCATHGPTFGRAARDEKAKEKFETDDGDVRRARLRRYLAPVVRNSVMWHLIGREGLGIKWSALWSAGVTVFFGIVRRFTSAEGRGRD